MPQVTSYLPTEWAGTASSLKLDTSWQDGLALEPGKSYYASWTTTFVGRVTVRSEYAQSLCMCDHTMYLRGLMHPNTTLRYASSPALLSYALPVRTASTPPDWCRIAHSGSSTRSTGGHQNSHPCHPSRGGGKSFSGRRTRSPLHTYLVLILNANNICV